MPCLTCCSRSLDIGREGGAFQVPALLLELLTQWSEALSSTPPETTLGHGTLAQSAAGVSVASCWESCLPVSCGTSPEGPW